MDAIVVQRVSHLDIHKLMPLVEESVSEGFRHIRRLVNDYETGANKFDKDGEALFFACQNNEIVGVCGLNQDPYANNNEVGRVRRLYVSQRVRRFGIGRLLMDSVIAEARKHYQTLVLKTDNPVADVFYSDIGFKVDSDSGNMSHFLRLQFNCTGKIAQ